MTCMRQSCASAAIRSLTQPRVCISFDSRCVPVRCVYDNAAPGTLLASHLRIRGVWRSRRSISASARCLRTSALKEPLILRTTAHKEPRYNYLAVVSYEGTDYSGFQVPDRLQRLLMSCTQHVSCGLSQTCHFPARLQSNGAVVLNNAAPPQVQRPPAPEQDISEHAVALQLDPHAIPRAAQEASSPSQWPLATGAERAVAAARRGNARALARGPRPTVQVTVAPSTC